MYWAGEVRFLSLHGSQQGSHSLEKKSQMIFCYDNERSYTHTEHVGLGLQRHSLLVRSLNFLYKSVGLMVGDDVRYYMTIC